MNADMHSPYSKLLMAAAPAAAAFVHRANAEPKTAETPPPAAEAATGESSPADLDALAESLKNRSPISRRPKRCEC
jgi:hypothetical protein